MARLIYPEDFLNQFLLAKKVADKHATDGAGSPIINFLTQQSIDVTTDTTNANAAKIKNDASSLLSKQKENYRQLRDLKFDPVFERLKKEIQFLKKFLSPNVSELGNWGVTVDDGNRIKYPTEMLDQFQLFTDFKAKYDTYAAGTSPLEAYLVQHNISMTDDETDTTDAFDKHNRFLQAGADSETATKDRNNLWKDVWNHIKKIGGFLKTLYEDNAKKLGDWGYTVDNSKRAPKYRTSKVKPAAQKIINGVIVGSTFTNQSTIDLHVYKGKTTIGTPAIVAPGGQLGMIKGYSVITVVNPSTLVTGKFRVLSSY